MFTHTLGYPRIGEFRELKTVLEQYWKHTKSFQDVERVAYQLRTRVWNEQRKAGIDFIPINDFSLYDHVLDHSILFGVIPERYQTLINEEQYFAMARGVQSEHIDLPAMEMTKWFDTNYHYIVPEFNQHTQFKLNSKKVITELKEALDLGISAKPVLLGPVSFLLLGKEKENGFHRLDLLESLLPVYQQLLDELNTYAISWIQIDEPMLYLATDPKIKQAYTRAFSSLQSNAKLMLTSYFETIEHVFPLINELKIDGIHLDLKRADEQLDTALTKLDPNLTISLGIVDGRNIWRNDLEKSLAVIRNAHSKRKQIALSSSCSFLHVPYTLENEGDTLNPEVKPWLAFAKEKCGELALLQSILDRNEHENEHFKHQMAVLSRRRASELTNNEDVYARVSQLKSEHFHRKSSFIIREQKQQEHLKLPLFPTTTIGSFPQTKDIRKLRSDWRKKQLSDSDYQSRLKDFTRELIRWQEDIGLDVLVHGEFERNDMVEYFGEQLEGFTFSENGWVQSYGTRCVKPPIIFGDVYRSEAMTLNWSTFAQSLTEKPVKGMLTGPVTILHWSFFRDDLPKKTICNQIALAIRDEVSDLENAGIRVIQIDEPAIREGLPLLNSKHETYLNWAVNAFKLASSGVEDRTQIHTHMCYSEFNEILNQIIAMDADVITIETSRSQSDLIYGLKRSPYPNHIGPGVYDIHSPRIPSEKEIEHVLNKALSVLNKEQLWVNPDCGLKTRGWSEVEKSLKAMVKTAQNARLHFS